MTTGNITIPSVGLAQTAYIQSQGANVYIAGPIRGFTTGQIACSNARVYLVGNVEVSGSIAPGKIIAFELGMSRTPLLITESFRLI